MSTLTDEAEPPVVPPIPGGRADAALTTIAGRYAVDLEAPLGVGGMALVYRGKDLRTRRDVALKTLRREYRDDPETRARFRREARLLAFLAHPNVVRVFDFVEDRGASWVVLEQVSGQSLKGLIEEHGPFPPAETAQLLEQAAAALGHLHARGLVHLDVKPQNLLLADDRRLKLIDFGLAQPAGQPQEAIGGRTFGTAAYLAPEQAAGESVDVATDVYALGCVAYELLSGRPPFAGDRAGEAKNDVIRARLERVPDPPSRVRPDLKLPPWIDDVLLWALAPDPAARYRSVQSFARVFRAGLEGERLVEIGTTGRAVVAEVPAGGSRLVPGSAAPTAGSSAGSRPASRGSGLLAWVGGRVARQSGAIQRGLWRWVAAIGLLDAGLAALLFLTQGVIPGLYEPAATLGPGSTARVVVDDLRMRDGAGLATTARLVLAEGERVTVTGDPVPGDGRAWLPVAREGDGATFSGFVAAEGLAPATPLERLRDAIGLD